MRLFIKSSIVKVKSQHYLIEVSAAVVEVVGVEVPEEGVVKVVKEAKVVRMDKIVVNPTGEMVKIAVATVVVVVVVAKVRVVIPGIRVLAMLMGLHLKFV